MEDAKLLNPQTLAFLGDAVYGLLVRETLCKVSRPSGELHRMSVEWVNANFQSEAVEVIEPLFTEMEEDIYKRGRNLHQKTIPKNSTHKNYHSATGLETLFGYLYQNGETERLRFLFDKIAENRIK